MDTEKDIQINNLLQSREKLIEQIVMNIDYEKELETLCLALKTGSDLSKNICKKYLNKTEKIKKI